MPLTTEEANALLPQTKHGEIADPKKLIYLFIAEAKFGKTTWMSAIENSLMLAGEKGHSFVEAYKINITCWDEKDREVNNIDGLIHTSFMAAVDIICASDQFDFVFLDTTDSIVKMCLDYNLKKLGIKHPSDWEFGKGYDAAMNTPFRQAINRLTSSGRGVGFITHTETKDARFSSGNKSRKECTLPGGIGKLLVPMADCILHGKFGLRNKDGKRDRIIVTEGSDDMLAGGRVQRTAKLPTHFIVDTNDPWGQWVSFFKDPKASEEAEAYYEKRKNSTGDTTEAVVADRAEQKPHKKAVRAATAAPKA